jgi:hypothetical protein
MKRPFLLTLTLFAVSASQAAPAKPTKPKTKRKIKAPAISPVEARVRKLIEQSDEAFHKGDYPTAVKLHRQIVKIAPDEIESYSVGAWLLWSLSQDRDISASQAASFKADERAFLAQGLKANPKNPEMWDAAGQQYALDKSFADAKVAFAKAVQLSGNKAPELLRRRMAHAAEGAGDWDLATRTWMNLVRDYPTEAVNKNNLARVQAKRSKM